MFNGAIFDRETQTKLKILDIIGSDSQWYSAEKLSQITAIERKTILKYINELIDDSLTFAPGNDLVIHSIKSRGISLEAKNSQLIAQFKLFILENTFAMDLLKRLLFHLPCNLTKLAQQFFVSESTIRRKIKLFKEMLAPFSIDVIYKDKSYLLIGSELQIRMYAYITMWTIYRGNVWPFELLDEKKMSQLTKQLLLEFGIDPQITNTVELDMLTYILAINSMRQSKGQSLSFQSPKLAMYRTTNQVEEANLHLTTDSHLTEDERQFYFILLQTFSRSYTFQAANHRIISAHKKNNTIAYQATVLFFTQFEANFETKVSKETYNKMFGHLLASHIFTDLFKGFEVDMSGYSLTEKTQELYPRLSKTLYHLVDQLFAASKLPLFLERERLHMKYMLFYSMTGNLSTFEKSIRIRFESDLPELISRILKDSILNTFKTWYNIQVVEITPTTTESEREVDVIIATLDIATPLKNQPKFKTVYITPDFTFDDFLKLGKIFKEIAHQGSFS